MAFMTRFPASQLLFQGRKSNQKVLRSNQLSIPSDSTIPMSKRRDATFILRVLATNKSPRKPSLVPGSICKASLYCSDFAHVRGAPLPYIPVRLFDELSRQPGKLDSLELSLISVVQIVKTFIHHGHAQKAIHATFPEMYWRRWGGNGSASLLKSCVLLFGYFTQPFGNKLNAYRS